MVYTVADFANLPELPGGYRQFFGGGISLFRIEGRGRVSEDFSPERALAHCHEVIAKGGNSISLYFTTLIDGIHVGLRFGARHESSDFSKFFFFLDLFIDEYGSGDFGRDLVSNRIGLGTRGQVTSEAYEARRESVFKHFTFLKSHDLKVSSSYLTSNSGDGQSIWDDFLEWFGSLRDQSIFDISFQHCGDDFYNNEKWCPGGFMGLLDEIGADQVIVDWKLNNIRTNPEDGGDFSKNYHRWLTEIGQRPTLSGASAVWPIGFLGSSPVFCLTNENGFVLTMQRIRNADLEEIQEMNPLLAWDKGVFNSSEPFRFPVMDLHGEWDEQVAGCDMAAKIKKVQAFNRKFKRS